METSSVLRQTILIRYSLLATLAAIASSAALAATSPAAPSGYSQPPKEILDVMRAPSPPVPSVSPTQDKILLVSWQDYPSMARVATPFLRLAGARVEIRNHSKHDTPGGYGIKPCANGLELVQVADGARTPVVLPITSGGNFARTAGFAVSLTDAGIRTTGVVRCDQPRALDMGSRNGRRLESVPAAVMDEVLAKLTPIFE